MNGGDEGKMELYKSNSLTVQNFTTGGLYGFPKDGRERGRELKGMCVGGRKEGTGAEGEDNKRVEGVGDQDKMENSGSIALGNRTMEKKVERKTERQR